MYRVSAVLERLPFNNVALKKLPTEDSQGTGSRTVHGACFSRIHTLQPLDNPTFVAVSESTLALIGLSQDEVLSNPLGPEYLSGSKLLPGSELACHCYCGHQFGMFAGQLGDGAVMYLGEVEDATAQSPSGRWEIQVKGAGITPYSSCHYDGCLGTLRGPKRTLPRTVPHAVTVHSAKLRFNDTYCVLFDVEQFTYVRDGDGRKVLRSSIREFLCSEAMSALGIPTTRAASLVTSDLYVHRDPLNDGRRLPERCSVVLRTAASFIRFGSFEIFLGRDGFSGLQGPSAGRHDLRAQLLDYVIETFYPHIQTSHSDRKDRNTAFFKEVAVRTAELVARWQSIGFCHGVLNTDNMSILGLTLDYGPFGFMDRFDPDYVSNASDRRGRYSYQAQPSVCRWNLARLAEALGPELHAAMVGAILDEFTPSYEVFYLGNMRGKLGLLRKREAADAELVSDLLRLMHSTGADFTNTFRLLSSIPWPEEGDDLRTSVGPAVQHILEQCTSIEELKVAECTEAEQRELAMILSLAQSNPAMFDLVAATPVVSQQLEKMGQLREILATNQDELRQKQRDDWIRWAGRYRQRLAREEDEESDLSSIQRERVSVMKRTNPRVVLRNYIAHNAIQAAQQGDFSEVHRVLKALENPYSDGVESEIQDGSDACGGRAQKEGTSQRKDYYGLAYDSRPPAWAREICVA